MMLGPWARGLAVLAVVAIAGCVPPKQEAGKGGTPAKHQLAMTAVPFTSLPGWQQDHTAEALAGFLGSCGAFAATPADQSLGGAGDAAAKGGSPAAWRAACAAAGKVPAGNDAAARAFFESTFQPYALADAEEPDATRAQGLFTGYFEPEVAGNRSPGGQYKTPLLGRPGDLVQVDLGEFITDLHGRSVTGRVQDGKLVPYYSRADIEGGALARRRLELVWLADPIDAFILQIQGSGRVALPGGKEVRVSYAGQNGRPYVPIGRVLADRGQIPLDQVSLQSIRAWLEAHPSEAAEVMNQNPSFVFFRELPDQRADIGPPGALGVPLLPGRSAAVDRDYIPMGAPVFIATTDPLTGAAWQRLMLAQDRGGAIRGPVRADIFFGWGKEAEARAGKMRQKGTAYLLLPRGPSA